MNAVDRALEEAWFLLHGSRQACYLQVSLGEEQNIFTLYVEHGLLDIIDIKLFTINSLTIK